jgi:5-formyltetrahydrofolate cyclo-ligase
MDNQQKAQLRRQLLEWRSRLGADEVQARSHDMVKRIIQSVSWHDVRWVHCYMPIGRNNEIDTTALFHYLWKQWPTIKTAVPMMRQGVMRAAIVDDKTVWQASRYQTKEPMDAQEVADTQQFDLIIVPTLGFNEQRYRLGYGGGHYDRFLASQHSAMTTGLCYKEGLVVFEHEPHDIPLQTIITG